MSGVGSGRDFGAYRLLQPLGRGGMGTVYAALQRSLQRVVALKLLSPEAVGERAMWRFQREARLLAQLDHPGIVKGIDSGVVDGQPYFAMELVAGASLARVLEHLAAGAATERDGGAIARCVRERADAIEPQGAGAVAWSLPAAPRRAMVAIAAEVATALASAHAAGVVHRDVKPSNILIRRDGAVRIADFGIAHRADAAALTATGDLAGTPSYMAPEQLRGDAVDHRADVFALGVVLYEALTLRLPFPGRTVTERLAALDAAPLPASRFLEGLGRDLSAVLATALAASPTARYRSMGEFAVDLRAILAGQPVRARPPGLVEAMWRSARRRPWLVVATLLLVVAVVGLVGIDLAGRRQVRAESEKVAAALADVHRLALGVRLDAAIAAAATFRVARHEDVPAMQRWLADHAAPLQSELPSLQAMLSRLRDEALPYGEAEHARDIAGHPALAVLARIDDERSFLDEVLAREPGRESAVARQQLLQQARDEQQRTLDGVRSWRLVSAERQFLHDQVAALVGRLQEFAVGPRSTVAQVEAQRAWAERSHRRTVVEAAALWERAAAEVAADARFHGLQLRPQRDLVPLAKDPASGLWEFVHLRSGEPGAELPERGADGRLRPSVGMGIVFVLLPGGPATIGAQRQEVSAPHHDPMAQPEEGPVAVVTLPPFFCSKYETTAEQWSRLVTRDSAAMEASDRYSRSRDGGGLCRPVDSVSQNRALRVLGDHGLQLPSEEQWEYACRAGTSTPFWFGSRARAVECANFADGQARRSGLPTPDDDLDDGFPRAAPVGSFAANPFGLHDMLGNINEIVAGRISGRLTVAVPGTRLREQRYDDLGCLARGGCYRSPLAFLRASARRDMMVPDQAQVDTGLRAVRPLER